MAEPYNVMGGFQDHEIWRGPNEKWNQVGVREGDWLRLRYMADGMHTIADPRDPNIIYYNGHFGDITRLDMRNREERYIQPYPPGPIGGGAMHDQYRFNWNSPVHMSPTNPDVLYFGGNVLFKTTDQGEHWSIISPDLVHQRQIETDSKWRRGLERQHPCGVSLHDHLDCREPARCQCDLGWDRRRKRSGHARWRQDVDQRGAQHHRRAEVLVGLVDIGVHDQRGDGLHLDRSAPPRRLRAVCVRHDRLRQVVAAHLRRPQGLRPRRQGRSEGSQPDLCRQRTGHLCVVRSRARAGPTCGSACHRLAVVDLVVHPRDNDLVIATHARGFYILDDATPLQQIAAGRAVGSAPVLFPPMPAVRYIPASDTSVLGNRVWVAPNGPYGAILNYYLPEAASSGVTITVADRTGRTVSTFSGPGARGVNRTSWNLSEVSSCGPAPAGGGGRGGRGGGGGGGTWIRSVPGDYTVRLTALGTTVEQPVTVRRDPRLPATTADMNVWYSMAQKIERTECTLRRAVIDLADVESALGEATG